MCSQRRLRSIEPRLSVETTQSATRHITIRCQFCDTWNRVDASRAADRPKCGNYGANSPLLFPERCVSAPTCGGGDNLMFWFLREGVSAGTLTGQQSQVMRFNPLAHP